MFGYENMNGLFSTTYHGTRNVLKQLCLTVMLKQRLPFMAKRNAFAISEVDKMLEIDEHTYALGKVTKRSLSNSERAAVAVYGLSQDVVPVVGRVMRNRVLLHSCLHKTDGTRNNRICEFNIDNKHLVGEIDFFILGQIPLAMVKVVRKVHPVMDIRASRLHAMCTMEQYIHAFVRVEKLSQASTKMAIPISSLSKCIHIYMKYESTDYVVSIPNTYETLCTVSKLVFT